MHLVRANPTDMPREACSFEHCFLSSGSRGPEAGAPSFPTFSPLTCVTMPHDTFASLASLASLASPLTCLTTLLWGDLLQGGENTFEAGLGLHNATGRAEHVVATIEYGTQSSSQASLSYEQPHVLGLPAVVGVYIWGKGGRVLFVEPQCGLQ
jgi:hypothetical protein